MTVVLTALALLVLLLAAVWCWVQWKFRRIISTLSKLPPVTPIWPLLGNLHLLFRGYDWIPRYLFKILQQLGERKEKNLAFWWGPYPYILVGVGEDIETVLTSKKCEKSFHFGFLKIFFGNGLVTAPDHIHKITRHHCNPLFTPRNLERLSSSFNSSSRSLAQAMSEHVGRGSVDVQHMAVMKSSKPIADLLLGSGCYPDEETELFKLLVKTVRSTATWISRRMVTPWLWSDILYNLLYGDEIRASLQTFDKICEEVHEKKERRTSVDSHCNTNNGDFNMEYDSPALLTLPKIYEAMEQKYPQITKKDLDNELATLFVTGSHTMRAYVSSMFLALATCPDIQERLYQEVVSVVGTEDSDVTMEDLKRMPYLEQIVKETSRRFFVVPILIRKAKEDLKLRDLIVPAGTMIIASTMTQQYNSEVFPDPQAFIPERFSSENLAKINKHNFNPFGAGTRMCIGYSFAYYLAKVMAVHVIRRFRLTSSIDINNMKYNWDIAAISADGYHLEIHSRTPV